MKEILISIICACLASSVFSQKVSSDTINSRADFENIYSSKLFSDSLASSFIISIKKEVKEHRHASHSEHVVVLEGTAIMTLADSSFTIGKGDIIFIPKNTFHSVKITSTNPLKILSLQAPYFDGSDRIFK